MKSGSRVKYSGHLKMYWSWNMYLALSLFALAAGLFFVDRRAGLISLAFACSYYLVIMFIYMYYRPRILQSMIGFASRYADVQASVLRQIEIPTAIVDREGYVLWMNDPLSELTGKTERYYRPIDTIFPYLTKPVFPVNSDSKDIDLDYEEKQFRAHIQKIDLKDVLEDSPVRADGGGRDKDRFDEESDPGWEDDPYDASGKGGAYRQGRPDRVYRPDGSYDERWSGEDVPATMVYVVYFIDETELNRLRRENREEKSVVALVYLDNYEEAMDNVDEVHSSLMNVLIDREINKYSLAHHALSKKLEKDKYLLIMNQKSLGGLEGDHFSLLEEVKTVNIGNETVMTISIGIGVGGDDYNQNYDYARAAMEMALGRGGDQAVLNRDGQMKFYGGKSHSSERHTRVKARVKAQAMREIIESKERVLAMGHKITDMDSLGAAVGIYRAAKTLEKQAWIVIGDDSPSIRNWLEMLRESRDYEEDIFISHEKAIELCDDNAALVVVDTARKTMVECEELLQRTKTIVVLDHHRQSTEQIQNAALSYIEPGASSTCEMVAEILQYFEENVRLRSLEADCLYAGIIIDTNNFSTKTNSRTFEAAAYLRRKGADTVRVRKALRDDMNSYKARAEAVRHAESFMGRYAISILPNEGLESPTVVGAQAANELLNIIGVTASFVVTKYGGKVYISARAIDEVNVQVIMERLGGGGHMNSAGAQMQDVTCEEAVVRVKEILRSMTEAGEI